MSGVGKKEKSDKPLNHKTNSPRMTPTPFISTSWIRLLFAFNLSILTLAIGAQAWETEQEGEHNPRSANQVESQLNLSFASLRFPQLLPN